MLTIPWEVLIALVTLFIVIIGALLTFGVKSLQKMFEGLENKVLSFCRENHDDHAEIKKKISKHGHKKKPDGTEEVVFYEA